jgi:hypothetical protein
MKILLFAVVVIILPTAGIASHVYGTNESSYKYGYVQGKGEWGDCQIFDAECSIALDDCHSPVDVAVKYAKPYVKRYDIVTNQTACIDGYIHAWNHVCKQPQANDNGVLCPSTFELETANTVVGTDHMYNGTTNKPTNQTVTWSIDKGALIQNSYKLGYDTGINDWNQHMHRYECPISHLAPQSDFCKGYDAALKYENGVGVQNAFNSTTRAGGGGGAPGVPGPGGGGGGRLGGLGGAGGAGG